MLRSIKIFLYDRHGATSIEYGIMAVMISLTVMAGADRISGNIDEKFAKLSNAVSGTDKRATGSVEGGKQTEIINHEDE